MQILASPEIYTALMSLDRYYCTVLRLRTLVCRVGRAAGCCLVCAVVVWSVAVVLWFCVLVYIGSAFDGGSCFVAAG